MRISVVLVGLVIVSCGSEGSGGSSVVDASMVAVPPAAHAPPSTEPPPSMTPPPSVMPAPGPPAPPPAPVPPASTPPAPPPSARLDHIAMVLVVGDSIAAGYDARGRNDRDGNAFARLLANDLSAAHPGLELRAVAESGATSTEIVGNLRDALDGSLPREVDGDVLLLVSAGGNDVNDNVLTLIDDAAASATAATLRANLGAMLDLVRARYERPELGRDVVALVHDIHDPTDGMGRIPPGFDDGFCRVLSNPLLATVAPAALANLDRINAAIADEVSGRGGYLVGVHGAFLGHGMNGGAGRWLAGDCAHPNDAGHSAIRDLERSVLDGP